MVEVVIVVSLWPVLIWLCRRGENDSTGDDGSSMCAS